MNRSWGNGIVAVGCLGTAAFFGWYNRPEAPEAQPDAKTASTQVRRTSFSTAPSAPAPVYEAPKPNETAKALQAMLDARPEVQAQKRAIEAKAASGVDAVMLAWREKPLDQETAVQTVMALKKIGTPEADAALSKLKRESPTACGVMALMHSGGAR